MTRTQLFFGISMIAVAVLATLGFVFLRSTPVATTDTWSAGGGFLPWSDSAPLETPVAPMDSGLAVESLGIVPLPSLGAAETDAGGGFDDLAALLAQLVQPQAPSSSREPTTPSAYSLIPQGLLSFQTERARSPEQQALHEYGNSLGLTLQAFADLHPNMPQILKDQAEDRSDSVKAGAVKRLASDFIALGDDLAGMDSVPAAASSAHAALASAYRDAGTKLSAIPDAPGDTAFLDAINAYNGSAENLSKRLVAMVDLFMSRDVTFAPTDAGSVFTFSGNASF